MKKLLTSRRNIALTLLLGGWASTGLPQSLGSPSGGAWIGQPLEISVPARLAAIDGGDCVHADVFYGEGRLAANRVRTTVTGAGEQRRVRIETDAPIDEPVVTVSLRAGCRNTVTRNYTLLPEMPSEPVVAALARPTAIAAALGGSAAPVPLRMAQSTSGPTSPRIARRAEARAAAAPVEAAPRMRMARAKAPHREAAVLAAGPRLRLDPVELNPSAFLRVSATLADAVGDPSRRATAALLWQAINADPQEVLRTSAMLQKLEQDLVQLRQSAGQTQSEMASLRRRIDETQPWYLSPALVQLLGLLLLAGATATGVLWYRSRRDFAFSDPWYGADARRDPQDPTFGAVPRPTADAPATPLAMPAPQEEAAPVRIPPKLPEVLFRAPPAVPTTPANLIDFEVAQPQAERRPTSGVLRVETLAATFDEVDFLSSMGLHTDATDVLKSYLQDSQNPAPLAFLELMRLCDEGEDATALPMVRRRYVQAFGMEAPRLDQVVAPVGLESRRDLCTRITKTWGQPAALEVIEEALFTVPKPGAPITLQAGRDLLCLYDLGLALLTESASVNMVEADAHPVAPWAHATDAADAQQAANSAAEAQGGHNFALDLDLTAGPGALPDPVQPPEVAPLLASMQAAAAREHARRAQEQEDAFSAAVASDRAPISRH